MYLLMIELIIEFMNSNSYLIYSYSKLISIVVIISIIVVILELFPWLVVTFVRFCNTVKILVMQIKIFVVVVHPNEAFRHFK